MKIAIVGYSGSGKSTLAQKLADKYGAEVLHFDTVQFLPDWVIRNNEDKKQITEDFLDTHESWIIDGNYSKLFYERRMEEADQIILLLFNRFSCLFRAFRRYLQYKKSKELKGDITMIDARGFSCPEPVIMIKKAMASKEDRYDMMVDNKVSVENVTRFAEYNGYEVACEADGEDYKLSITKK